MAQWQLTGDYFENCNCDVVCPCLISTGAPLTARPSRGVCDVMLAFHIDSGTYDGVRLDGLNIALAVHAPPERVGDLAAEAGIPLHELVAETGSLEEAFLELTAEPES